MRTVFITCLTLLVFGRMEFTQPILYIIGYVDVALLVFLVWIGYRFLKRLISPRRPYYLSNPGHRASHNLN